LFIKLIICLWGAVFQEYWKRNNIQYAFEWDVNKFEADERPRPEYVSRTKIRQLKLADKSDHVKYIWSYESYFKKFVSLVILLFMVIVILRSSIFVSSYSYSRKESSKK
jgi:anoctamin-1